MDLRRKPIASGSLSASCLRTIDWDKIKDPGWRKFHRESLELIFRDIDDMENQLFPHVDRIQKALTPYMPPPARKA